MSNDSNSSSANNGDESDDPQCNLIVGIDKLNLLDRGETSQPNNNDNDISYSNVEGGGEAVCCLQSLSDDVLLNVLLYCGPTDVEESLKLVNRGFQ